MNESPDAILRRVLAELYPRPRPFAGFAEALKPAAASIRAMSAALSLGTAGYDLRPDECGECGYELEGERG